MPGSYRIYCLDRGNQVVNVEWVTAPTDDEAMNAARAMTFSGMREVWIGERLVGTITIETVEEPPVGLWL